MSGTQTALRTALLEAVAAIAPIFEAEAEASERLGRLSDSSMQAIRSAGLIGLRTPKMFGGYEADPLTELEVLEAASRADGSAGWCLGILTGSNAMAAAYLPRESAEEIFANGPVPMAGAPTPHGKAQPKDDGYILNGRWAFGSGIHHAEYVIAGARIEGISPPAGLRIFVLPRSQVEPVDNWQVAGLRATGSCDYEIHDTFVPTSHSFSLADLATGQAQSGGPSYRLGLPGIVSVFHIGIPLGIARRALDEIIHIATTKRRGMLSSVPLAERDVFQSKIGKAELQLASARALALDVTTRAWETVQAGEALAPAVQAELRGAGTYITEVTQEIATMAFHAGGGAALFDSSPLQRCFRDVHAAGQHFIASDSAYQGLGRFRLGHPEADAMM